MIAFALPSIFLLPWLADVFGLSDAVAGAWIGGNIDTTAAVAASGAIAGENALQIATIVKTTQNALIGVVAIALTAYFALKVERTQRGRRAAARWASSGSGSRSSCSASSPRRSSARCTCNGSADGKAEIATVTTCAPGS